MAKVTLKGNEVSLGGKDINVGDNAPKVSLIAQDLSMKDIGGAGDKNQLLIVFPSLDTPVCAVETKKFNEQIASLDNVEGTIISMDLPFAAKRFCSVEGTNNLNFVSDFRDRSFGDNYGVLISEGPFKGLHARAIFLVDKNGKLAYKQIVSEVTDEPNYDEVLEKIKSL